MATPLEFYPLCITNNETLNMPTPLSFYFLVTLPSPQHIFLSYVSSRVSESLLYSLSNRIVLN